MSKHSTFKTPTTGLKRKLKTHTIETKFQALADVERGTNSKEIPRSSVTVPVIAM